MDRVTSPLTVSPALAADYPAFARLFPELAVPEDTPSADRFAQTIAPDAIVLRDGDGVVGYAWARPRGEQLHVVHLIADPAHRRRGVGRALMAAVAERGRGAGFRRWMLNVKPENVAARALYERCGLRVVLASVSMRVAWADVSRIAPATGVVARRLPPADDARFEDAFALSRGELSAFRALGRILVAAEDTGGAVGVIAFDPSYPDAVLLRAVVPAHARALLDGIRPHALPDHDHLHVVVEGDPALETTLTAAGAQAVIRALRMEGDIAF